MWPNLANDVLVLCVVWIQFVVRIIPSEVVLESPVMIPYEGCLEE